MFRVLRAVRLLPGPLVALLCALALPAAPHATPFTPLVSQGGDPALYDSWLARFKVPYPPITIYIDHNLAQGQGAQAYFDAVGRAHIDLAPDAGPEVFAHAMGIIYDAYAPSLELRELVAYWMGREGKPWDSDQFAEVYRILALHSDRLKSPRAWAWYSQHAHTSLTHIPHYWGMRKIQSRLLHIIYQ